MRCRAWRSVTRCIFGILLGMAQLAAAAAEFLCVGQEAHLKGKEIGPSEKFEFGPWLAGLDMLCSAQSRYGLVEKG